MSKMFFDDVNRVKTDSVACCLPAVAGKSLPRGEARQKWPQKATAPNVRRSNGTDSAPTQQHKLSALSADAASCSEKLYAPDEFSGEHVTELMTENTALKNKVATEL